MEQALFSTYLVSKRRGNPRLFVALLAAAFLWSSFLALLIVYSLFDVPLVSPPPLVVQWLSAAPLPQTHDGPKPGKPNKPRAPHPPRAERPTLVQPSTDPPKAAPGPVDNAPPGPDDGADDGPPGGPPEGTATGLCPPGAPCGPAPPPPPPPPEKPKTVPAFKLNQAKLSGELPLLPEVIKAQRRGTTVTGFYHVCIDREGAVSTVRVIAGVPGADDDIVTVLRTWRFRSQPVPLCAAYQLDFKIE